MATATKQQKMAIRRNCDFNVDIKEEFVQWATQDNSKTSLNDLSFEQAQKIIKQQTGSAGKIQTKDNWALFDKNNAQHKAVLSQLRQLQWTIKSEKWGEVADIERLSSFLKSDKSPVQKRLKDMDQKEVSKIIECLKSMLIKRFK